MRVAQAWWQLTALFGYRLRPGSGITFEAMATLLSATMRGLVVMALSSPEAAGQRIEASPFGASAWAEWSLPALGLGGIASAFLEPDPRWSGTPSGSPPSGRPSPPWPPWAPWLFRTPERRRTRVSTDT